MNSYRTRDPVATARFAASARLTANALLSAAVPVDDVPFVRVR